MSFSTSSQHSTRWLFSPTLDILAFVGPAFLAFVLVLIGHSIGIYSTPSWIFLLCIVGVDITHVHSTVFRVYLDPYEVKRRPIVYIGTPIFAYMSGLFLYTQGGPALFWRCLAYMAVWHFVRQQAGWVKLYRARTREAFDPTRAFDRKLDLAAVYIATLYPLLVWHTQLPKKFWWFVHNDFVAGVSPIFVTIVRPMYWIVLFLFLTRQVQLLLQRKRINIGKIIVVLSTFFTWYMGIVFYNDDFAFTVTNVLPHGIPYFILIALYARKRYADLAAPKADLGLFFVRIGWGFAYSILVAIALFEESLWDRWVWHDHESIFGIGTTLSMQTLRWIVPLLALPQAVHYILDGFIWTRNKNPQLAKYL